ncbi:MAG: thioredoxin-dependent thiol peroxidase [Bacteroidota bacterium]
MAHEYLAVGAQAPDVKVKNNAGEEVSLADLKGKKVVVFFYPKANSPSCTKEAVSLKDHHKALQDLGYEVIGVSPDKEKSLTNFINKHELPYTLWSDPENELTEAFGAWGEKSMYGKTYMGLLRSTFLIDEEGKVSHVIEKVKTKEHAQQILAMLAEAV